MALLSLIVAKAFGLGSHGAILGGIAFVGTIGGGIGPLVAGHIFNVSGSYQTAFLVSTALSPIGLILVCLLKLPLVKGSIEEGRNDTRRNLR